MNFTDVNCSIQNKLLLKTIGKVEFIDGIYLLHMPRILSTTLACKATFGTWHQQLGHPSLARLIALRNTLSFYSKKSHEHCRICSLAKQKRLSFPFVNHVSEHTFDLVHCDVWGPFSTKTHVGHSYFLTLVDDCSRYTWVYLLKHKNEVLHVIPHFFKMIETQFSKRIKVFRSDNAPELSFTEFFASIGTLHQFSCVNTQQQNSVVERKHQQLLNVARALMFQSHVPLTFWDECILTATHLINRTPMVLLSNHAPFTILHERPIDYSLLRVFGCLAYASTSPIHRIKFDSRASPCVFMGYPSGVKGFRLYDVHKKTFFISRDVLFFEDLSPFNTVRNHNASSCPSDFFDQFVLPCSHNDISDATDHMMSSLSRNITESTAPPPPVIECGFENFATFVHEDESLSPDANIQMNLRMLLIVSKKLHLQLMLLLNLVIIIFLIMTQVLLLTRILIFFLEELIEHIEYQII